MEIVRNSLSKPQKLDLSKVSRALFPVSPALHALPCHLCHGNMDTRQLGTAWCRQGIFFEASSASQARANAHSAWAPETSHGFSTCKNAGF